MKAVKKAEDCKHDSLHFEAGGLYLVCDNCKYVYAAVGFCPARIIQDTMARNKGLSETDKRCNPLALAKTTPTKLRPSQFLIQAVKKSK